MKMPINGLPQNSKTPGHTGVVTREDLQLHMIKKVSNYIYLFGFLLLLKEYMWILKVM